MLLKKISISAFFLYKCNLMFFLSEYETFDLGNICGDLYHAIKVNPVVLVCIHE